MGLEIDIETLREEVETAIRVFYAYEAAMRLLSEQAYVDSMNKNVYFWKIFLSSAQTKLFIALGRLYDDSNDTFSFAKFIRTCRENINEFGKDDLESRRLKGSAVRPPWLDGFLANAHFATIEDIDVLAKLTRPFNKKMKGLYEEIRNKVFAHAVHTDEAVISNLFKGTNFEEIENALIALWSVYSQIWQMYENGLKPTLLINAYPYKDEVYECVKAAVTGRI